MSQSGEIRWKENLEKSARAALIMIKNNTSVSLTRVSFDIPHGVWKHFPDEKVEAHGYSEFATTSSGLMVGTEASVSYEVRHSSTIKESFTFRWSNPFFGNKTYSYQHSARFTVEVTEAVRGSVYQVLFILTSIIPLKEFYGDSSLSETDHNNISPNNSSSNIPTLTLSLSNMNTNNENHSTTTTGAEEPEWQKRWARAPRSVMIVIHNCTQQSLIRRDYRLPTGQWLSLPAERINPGIVHQFATESREGFMTGTDGEVFYWLTGHKGDLRMTWRNPWLGSAGCSSHCSALGHTIDQVITNPSKRAIIHFYVHDDSHKSTMLNNSSPNSTPRHSTMTSPLGSSMSGSMLNTSLLNNSLLHSSISIPKKPSHALVRVLTLNTDLLSNLIGGKDPAIRAGQLAQFILQNKEKDIKIGNEFIQDEVGFDIVVLQEVAHEASRVKLISSLVKDFPYMWTRNDFSLINGGLFLASKFPILRSEFRKFPEASGSLTNKGVLGVKLDVSGIMGEKDFSMFVFNVHLHPDSNYVMQLLTKDTQEVIEARIEFVRQFIHDMLITETHPSKCSVLLCGDFNVKAEDTNNRKSQSADQQAKDIQNKAVTEAVSSIIQMLDKRSVSLSYSYQLGALLKKNSVPLSYLGFIRSNVSSARGQSFAMIEMISLIVTDDIYEEIRNKNIAYEEDLQELILNKFNTVLYPLPKSHSANRSPRVSTSSMINNSILSNNSNKSTVEQNNNNNELSIDNNNNNINNHNNDNNNNNNYHDTTLAVAAEKFWKVDIKEKLIRRFPGSLNSREEDPNYDLRKSSGLPFQLFRSLQTATGVQFRSQAEIKLLSLDEKSLENGLVVSEVDVKSLNFETVMNGAKMESSSSKLSSSGLHTLPVTKEYVAMMNILRRSCSTFPVDIFRSKNPYDAGWTIEPDENQLAKGHDSNQRVDYIIAFDKIALTIGIPNSSAEVDQALMHLDCVHSKVVKTSRTPLTQLSDHYGVEGVFQFFPVKN